MNVSGFLPYNLEFQNNIKQLLIVLCVFLNASLLAAYQVEEKPNVLWITCEDISPYLGSYDFQHAYTPNLDSLAIKGIRYTNAYANAPVCGVARSTILTGMYAPTLGTHNFRTNTQLPVNIPAYPKILREAGYYCTNNYKKDYNSNYQHDTTLWDVSNKKAHYDTRKEGQPFFSVFNITVTHESQLAPDKIKEYVTRKELPETPRIDPSAIDVPPYHPDLPEVRQDWARFHDLITLMDQKVGDLLRELKEKKLADDTIIFFYSDHGGMLSRSKRYLYNVGTQVPFIVYFPEKWQHLSKYKPGSVENGLVSFVDFPKALLSLLECPVPNKMQGNIFLGKHKKPFPKYVHFYRDRMSERYDFNRAVTDGTYYLIYNFMPHRPRGRSTRYGYTVQQNWRANESYYEEGKANEIQSQFYAPKKAIEFFDTENDPWHIHNIALVPENKPKLKELSDELYRWMLEIRDIGFIPEAMFADLAGVGKKYKTIYEYAQSKEYHIEKILPNAKIATRGSSVYKNDYMRFVKDANPIIRYWGAYGLFLLAENEEKIQDLLQTSITKEPFPANRIMMAQALAFYGAKKLAFEYLYKEVKSARDGYVFLFGLNALQYSQTDVFLTKKDWMDFQKQEFISDDSYDQFGKTYSQRIITDALTLWPNRRKVD